MKPFVHLHGHTEYSLLDGISRLDDMIAKAVACHMPALAITDHGNMYGAINFYKKAKAAGIKPIIGCEVYLTKGSRFDRNENGDRTREKLSHLILLAENNEGYANLVKIVSKAATEGVFYGKPRADKDLLAKHAKGLIALSACIEGEVPKAVREGNMDEARRLIEWYIDVFGKDHFFLEIQDHNMPDELVVQNAFELLSKEYGIGMVATNDFHYVNEEDADAHDVKLCISTGKRRADIDRLRFPNEQFYMKNGDEMSALFATNPEAIENTLRIAERCNVELDFSSHHLPHFDVPEGETAKSYLRKVCEERIPDLYGDMFPALEERLNYELDVIGRMGFEDYFLIVWDYVYYAQTHNIIVGPGRGSAAGSVVAYLLGITGLDPLKYNLLFERFLNPERISMPDIDIDFCFEKRGQVIEYVTKKYGADKVSQIITFGTEGARAVIRDVGRVLDVPLSEVNRVAKLIPFDPNMTLEKALEVPELKEAYETEETVREIFDLAKQLEGIARNTSTHAAGVVIAAAPLDDYVPIQNANDVGTVTQYDKDNIESLGLLKMDFLGLRTLTVMDIALHLIEQNRGVRLDINKLPLDDKATCDLLTRGETAGVFQLESSGITKLVKDLKPVHFEDLIPLVALYRPGPLGSGMVADFINRRHGRADVDYLVPVLEPILKDTFGVILYQEQVMQIASAMGGFTLGESDILRRAMGKKKEKEILKQRDNFLEGTRKNGYKDDVSNAIFDLILYFAGYGFNKSHSAAYAYIAYQTAYLKAHYFPEFLAATMTSFMTNMDKLGFYIDECRRHKTPVLGPSINQSEKTFAVQGNAIRFGLGGIKTVGDRPVEEIIRERRENGPYKSFVDFCKRVSSSAVNKRNIEGLIRCGALDEFGLNRRQLLMTYEQVQALGVKHQKDRAMGAMSLFGEAGDILDDFTYPQVDDLTQEEKLNDEKEYIGFYTSGHPLEAFEKEMEPLFPLSRVMNEGEELDGRVVQIGGLVVERRDIMTKKNDMMTVLQLEDYGGKVSVVVFPKLFRECRDLCKLSSLIRVKGKIDADERGVQIISEEIKPLKETRDKVKSILIKVRREYDKPEASKKLLELLQHTEGTTPVVLYIEATNSTKSIHHSLYVTPTDEVCAAIEAILGKGSVQLKF